MSDFTSINGVYLKDPKLWQDIEYIRNAIGYDDILGLEVDFENSTYKRLASAKDLTAGSDFNTFPMYGNRRKCNLADNGTVNAWYGEQGYTEDGSNGQVMVYQPKFYYKVVPLKLRLQSEDTDAPAGVKGYHLLKAQYFISSTPKTGFKLHPVFYNQNGIAVDGVYFSAYEGCLYDTSENTYIYDDAQIGDFTPTTGDKLSSVGFYKVKLTDTYNNKQMYFTDAKSLIEATVTAENFSDKVNEGIWVGVKPASGMSSAFNTVTARITAHNRGSGWELQNYKAISAKIFLLMIEAGSLNSQVSVAYGIVNASAGWQNNDSFNVGSTANLGNGTGRASTSLRLNPYYQGHTYNTTAECYRGVENDWGNKWNKLDRDVVIAGTNNMRGGEPYICTNYVYNDMLTTKADCDNAANYKPAGFTINNQNTVVYTKYFGYSYDFDWLFMQSASGGTASFPVGDGQLNRTKTNTVGEISQGGRTDGNYLAGITYLNITQALGSSSASGLIDACVRLMYIPQS